MFAMVCHHNSDTTSAVSRTLDRNLGGIPMHDQRDNDDDNDAAAWLAGRSELHARSTDWPLGLTAGAAGELAWRRVQLVALRDCAAGGDRALEFAVAALTLHDAAPAVARAVNAAVLAEVMVGGRDLSDLLARAWDAVTRVAGSRWPAYAEECFERACELLEIAAQQP